MDTCVSAEVFAARWTKLQDSLPLLRQLRAEGFGQFADLPAHLQREALARMHLRAVVVDGVHFGFADLAPGRIQPREVTP